MIRALAGMLLLVITGFILAVYAFFYVLSLLMHRIVP
jgi:hypothetical protein